MSDLRPQYQVEVGENMFGTETSRRRKFAREPKSFMLFRVQLEHLLSIGVPPNQPQISICTRL
jgi:hypothetical protein